MGKTLTSLALSDQDKEQIKFNTELIKILALSFLTTAGGTITLYLQRGPDVYTVTGTIFVILIGIAGYTLFIYTQKMINK